MAAPTSSSDAVQAYPRAMNRWSPRNGSRSTSARPTSWSWIRAGTCPRPAAAAARNILRRISPARAIWTSMRWLPEQSGPAQLPSASDFGDAMEQLGVGREDRIVVYENSARGTRRAAGSCCAISAPSGSRSSTAGSSNGWRKAGRPKAASRQRGRPASTPSNATSSSRSSNSGRQRLALARRPRKAALRGHRRRPEARRRCGPCARRPQLAVRFALPGRWTFQAARRDPAAVRGGRRRPDCAVRRQLRIGRYRQQPDLRRSSARQRRGNCTMAAGASGAPTRPRRR